MSFLSELLNKAKDIVTFTDEEKAQGKKPNLLERIPMRFNNRVEKVQDFFEPVPDKVRVRDFVREVPKATGNVIKEILQGTARSADFVGRKVLDKVYSPIEKKTGIEFTKGLKNLEEEPDDAITKTIFGGNAKRRDNLGDVAETEVGIDPEKYPVIAPLIGGTLVGLDVVPGGQGKGKGISKGVKALIKGLTDETATTLAKTTDPKIIEDVLRTTSKELDDDTVKELTENIAKIDSEDGIKKLITNKGNGLTTKTVELYGPGGEKVTGVVQKKKITDLKPSQGGEDLINETSQGYAKGRIVEDLYGPNERPINVGPLTKENNNMPPILVDKNGVIIDGNHRYGAGKIAGLDELDVIVLDDAQLKQYDITPKAFESETPKVADIKPDDVKESVQLPDSFYTQNITTKKPSVIKTRLKNALSEAGQGLAKGLIPISSRLEKIAPDLKTALRKYEFSVGRKAIDREKAVVPLLEISKKMDPQTRATFDLARKNGDAKKLQQLIIENNMGKEYSAYRKTLNDIYKEANKLGMDIAYRDHYAPRIIKDQKGFLDYLRGTENWDVISEAIRKKAKTLGKPVTDMTLDEQSQVANSMIRGYGDKISLARPGATKERAIEVIDKNINKFYEDSDTALVRYIQTMTDAIEAKKFFGAELNSKISKTNLIGRLEKRIVKKEDKIAGWKEEIAQLKKEKTPRANKKIETRKRYIEETKAENKDLARRIKETQKDVEGLSIDTNIDDSIGTYIIKLIADGKIKPYQEKEVADILKSRFNPHGSMNSALRSYKNLEYISTMGSPTSAITQIGDLGLSIYKNGLGRTIKSLGKKKIKREDIGIERIAEEFADGSLSGKAVDKIFKIVGLDRIDRFGKETQINGSYRKLKDTIDNPKVVEEVKRVFGDESDQFIKDVKDGNLSENVRFWLFNDLADMQPIAMSEMPSAYLNNPNGRIFYMLKSYTLKLLDIYRRDVFRKMKTEPVQAIKNFMYLGGSLAVMNATADELKDMLLGRETSLSDRVTESILKSVGLNRYTTSRIGRDGVGSVVLDQILPPASAIDSVSKTITQGKPQVLKQVPVVGKVLYERVANQELTPEQEIQEKIEKKQNTTVDDILKRKEKQLIKKMQDAGYSKRQAKQTVQSMLDNYRQ